jgi:hypothetical protein
MPAPFSNPNPNPRLASSPLHRHSDPRYTKPGTRHSKPRAYTPELWYHTRHSTRRKHRHQGKASKQASHLRAIRPARLPPLGSPTKPSERERERERQEHPKTTRINISHPIPYQSSAVSSHQTYTKRETPELSLEPPTILRQERATNSHVPSTSPLGPASSCASHVSHNTRDNGTVSHQTTRALHSARYR